MTMDGRRFSLDTAIYTVPESTRVQRLSSPAVDATYKIKWNELPLLVFGASDADRHFRSFGIALTSSDENSACYEQLFNQLRFTSPQEGNLPYSVNYLKADGALRITSAQQAVFLQATFNVLDACHS
ncbi:unnamed protein product [Didymodactylos carnosus]|uniref:Uncharacterized protein n=1 Tax=Didymodactylos carnosus TaxID=1234261 RepID=A0A815BK61_9BILA|nr:unnamed protein product [Didymodactylos carnosus]CAF4059145.1 unnamed protein product [Didymodactylos carnosus]